MAKLHLITAVVQHKVGDKVIEAALKAGATGATYFFAEGTGVRQHVNSDVEIAKRSIFIVVDKTKTDVVLDAVIEAGRLSQPGQGFACVQEVLRAVGFVPAETAAKS